MLHVNLVISTAEHTYTCAIFAIYTHNICITSLDMESHCWFDLWCGHHSRDSGARIV